MEPNLIDQGFIPLDKSWLIRMGVLDLVNGHHDIVDFLNKQNNLGDDLVALKRAATTWNANEPIDVGESGTLYRFLKFASWKLGLHKKFIIRGTLQNRKIMDNPAIIKLSQAELLNLDNHTSQWASAAVLLGNLERIAAPPYKLELTYEAVDHWRAERDKGEVWRARYDQTILRQAEAYLEILKNSQSNFKPEQAEDYCFAYAFGYIAAVEAEKRWPSLRNHESDRIEEMARELENAKHGETIASKDHRVIQAVAMWAKINHKNMKVLFPSAVNKSWPQFWNFLEAASNLVPHI